jgi:hypothetical protein
LILHEEKLQKRAAKCIRLGSKARLLSSSGKLAPVRCGAVNKCDYCARLAAVEITECLALDAVENGNAAQLWMVTTTKRYLRAKANS